MLCYLHMYKQGRLHDLLLIVGWHILSPRTKRRKTEEKTKKKGRKEEKNTKQILACSAELTYRLVEGVHAGDYDVSHREEGVAEPLGPTDHSLPDGACPDGPEKKRRGRQQDREPGVPAKEASSIDRQRPKRRRFAQWDKAAARYAEHQPPLVCLCFVRTTTVVVVVCPWVISMSGTTDCCCNAQKSTANLLPGPALREVNQGCGRCRVRRLVVHEVYFSEMTYAFCLCGLCKNPDQIQRTLLC